MDNNMLGFKVLYDVILKTTIPITIGGIEIEAGEPIATFESIQFGNVEEFKERVDARGGYGNAAHISWDTTKEVSFNFSQGIMSRQHLAILGNAKIERFNAIPAPMMEEATLDENLQVELKHSPILDTVFIYLDNGTKIKDYTIDENIITFVTLQEFEEVKIVYEFNYTNGGEMIVVGRELIRGYLELCGKTRLEDDRTGHIITGIIRIPKLKLMSDLSIRLGKDAPPVIGNFKTTGYPVGSRGNEKVMDLILLQDDIDSDIM